MSRGRQDLMKKIFYGFEKVGSISFYCMTTDIEAGEAATIYTGMMLDENNEWVTVLPEYDTYCVDQVGATGKNCDDLVLLGYEGPDRWDGFSIDVKNIGEDVHFNAGEIRIGRVSLFKHKWVME